MSSLKSRPTKARERFLLITLVSITSTIAILSVGLFFLSVPLSGNHHNDCSASNCRAVIITSSSKQQQQIYLQYDLTTIRNMTKTIQVLFDNSLLSDQSNSIPCIITPLSNQTTDNNNINIMNNINTNIENNFMIKTTITKSSSDNVDNSYSSINSLSSIPMMESSTIIITYNNNNYSISTNSSSSLTSNIPCYYNDANSFFFGMTFSLPKQHAQLELILGGVMIPFIILVTFCLCCLPLSTLWFCMKEDIMQRKQKVDFHKLDSTWDE